MSKLAVGQLEGLASEGYRITVASGSKLVQAGAILQVVSTTKTDTFTTSSTSFVDLTGLSLTLTPSSDVSKILLFVNVQGVSGVNTGDITSSIKLLRGSTDIAIGDAAGSRTRSFAGFGLPEGYNRNEQLFYTTTAGINFLDSPATTSSTTYKLQVRASGATLFINRSGQDDDNANYNRMVSTITAMEVAG